MTNHEAPRVQDDAPNYARASVNHTVQFYDTDDFLESGVAAHLAAGLAANEHIVVIATDAHRTAFLRSLKSNGVDTAQARLSGRMTMIDAREALSAFMVEDEPDARLFHSTVGQIVSDAVRRADPNGVRAYGEMVDLLWRDGNTRGAIRLEQLWNELAALHSFRLLCAYAMDNFRNESDSETFAEVCRQHGHIIPTESYTQIDESARLTQIATLQQRAAVLESEIAHRKDAEQKLRETLAERDNLIELERAARTEAEAANQAKAAFLATMSHELRTPLNAIGGYTELIECGVYGPVTNEQRASLARIQHSQRHLLTLINDVLNFAKIEVGHIGFQTKPIVVSELLARVEELVLPQFEAKGVHCRFADACTVDNTELPAIAISADWDRVCQVILNLMSNAVKFTEPGGMVTVSVHRPSPTTVSIAVHDTGHGISESDLSSVFEPFVQVGRSLSHPRDGVGLGLAISRELAEGMGGSLTVASELASGSVFTLTLPAA
ncbi:MAG TPA: ATP-binding protein [Gemmatimonadaceae bacterium]